MDPNQCWKEIVELAQKIDQCDDPNCAQDRLCDNCSMNAFDLKEHVGNLNNWIIMGGFPPSFGR